MSNSAQFFAISENIFLPNAANEINYGHPFMCKAPSPRVALLGESHFEIVQLEFTRDLFLFPPKYGMHLTPHIQTPDNPT